MAKTRDYHLNFHGMSGRVVRYRELSPDEIEEIEENAARSAGEDADERKLRREQLKFLCAAMIAAYTGPDQEPAREPVLDDEGKPVLDKSKAPVTKIVAGEADATKLAEATWTEVKDHATLRMGWSQLFSARESSALRVLYLDTHEINPTEIAMILGKSRSAPTGV